MSEIIIADTSCLILLEKINFLNILEILFSKVAVTPEVSEKFGYTLPDYIEVSPAKNSISYMIIDAKLGKGESSAIQLAIENPGCLLIIDELKGRKLAESLDIRITGALGRFIEAKLRGHIKSIKPILLKVKETDFRISEELELKALKLAKEKK